MALSMVMFYVCDYPGAFRSLTHAATLPKPIRFQTRVRLCCMPVSSACSLTFDSRFVYGFVALVCFKRMEWLTVGIPI